MALPKPYPPTKITFLDWNTVVDYVSAHAAFHEPGGADEINDIDIANTGTFLSAHESRHVQGGADDIDSAIDARGIALTTQGDLSYRAAAANTLARLPAGNDGQVLRTGGAGANPAWVDDVQSPDWILYEDAGTYYAKNGHTGEIPFSGANFVTAVWDNVVGSNRHIHFKHDTFVIDDDLDIDGHSMLYISFSNSTIEQSTHNRNHFHILNSQSIVFRGPARLWFEDALLPTAGACFNIGDGINPVHRVRIYDFFLGGGNAVMGGGVFTSGNVFYRGIEAADLVYGLLVSDIRGNEGVHTFILLGDTMAPAATGDANHQFFRCGLDNTNLPDDGIAINGTTFPLNPNGWGCSTGYGIHVRGSQGTWFTDMGVGRCNRGVYLDPNVTAYVDHVRFFDCDADANVLEGWRIADDNATTGRIWNIWLEGCYGGGRNNQGCVITETNEIREVSFNDCCFLFNEDEGVYLSAGPEYIHFTACRFRANNISNTGTYNVHVVGGTSYFYFVECLWLDTAAGGLDLFIGDWCSNFRLTGQTLATVSVNFPFAGGYPATDHQQYWVNLTGFGNTYTDHYYRSYVNVRATSMTSPQFYGGPNSTMTFFTDRINGAGAAYLQRYIISHGDAINNDADFSWRPDGTNVRLYLTESQLAVRRDLDVLPNAVNSRFEITDTAIQIKQDMTWTGAAANDMGAAGAYADDVYADTYYIKTPGAGAAHVTAFDGFDDLALINEIYPTIEGDFMVTEKYGIVKDGFINQMVERSLFVGAFKQLKTHRDETNEKIENLLKRVAVLEQQLGSG